MRKFRTFQGNSVKPAPAAVQPLVSLVMGYFVCSSVSERMNEQLLFTAQA